MSKLDEIQERIETARYEAWRADSAGAKEFFEDLIDLIGALAAELKRIDAEQKRLLKDLVPPDWISQAVNESDPKPIKNRLSGHSDESEVTLSEEAAAPRSANQVPLRTL